MQELRDAPATTPEELTTLPSGQKPLEDAGWIGISMHTYGCRIMQRIMESCELPGWKEPICREVHPLRLSSLTPKPSPCSGRWLDDP